MVNEIVIRSVYGKVQQTYFINPCPNPRTGKLPDCVKPIDSNGDMILSEKDVSDMSSGVKYFIPANKVIEIVDGTKFDLNDLVDKSHWEAIQYCNWIAKDRFERDAEGNLIIDGNAKKYGIADLYVERPGEISKATVTRKQLVFRASGYIYEDSPTNRLKKCRVLGRELGNALDIDVIDYMISIAEKEPKKIIDLYEGEDWRLHLFILDAIEKGVIKKSDGLYKHEDKLLGGSINAVISFLKDFRYKTIIDSIKRETYPNLLPQEDIDRIKSDLHTGIPHVESTDTGVAEVSTSKDKNRPATKLVAK